MEISEVFSYLLRNPLRWKEEKEEGSHAHLVEEFANAIMKEEMAESIFKWSELMNIPSA